MRIEQEHVENEIYVEAIEELAKKVATSVKVDGLIDFDLKHTIRVTKDGNLKHRLAWLGPDEMR